MFYRFTTYPYNHTTMFGNPNSADTLVDEFYRHNRGYAYSFEQSEDGKDWFAVDLLAVKPGDRIRASGLEFEVAEVLYQDHFGETTKDKAGQWLKHLYHDVEFIDNHGGYHHWKSLYDGGVIFRSEQPEKEAV